MVGNTRLYQHTGSPLIRGTSRRRSLLSRLAPWLVVLVIVGGVGAYLYLTYLR